MNPSDIDIRRGQKECPFTSISNGVIYFLITYYSESKECLEQTTQLSQEVETGGEAVGFFSPDGGHENLICSPNQSALGCC